MGVKQNEKKKIAELSAGGALIGEFNQEFYYQFINVDGGTLVMESGTVKMLCSSKDHRYKKCAISVPGTAVFNGGEVLTQVTSPHGEREERYLSHRLQAIRGGKAVAASPSTAALSFVMYPIFSMLRLLGYSYSNEYSTGYIRILVDDDTGPGMVHYPDVPESGNQPFSVTYYINESNVDTLVTMERQYKNNPPKVKIQGLNRDCGNISVRVINNGRSVGVSPASRSSELIQSAWGTVTGLRAGNMPQFTTSPRLPPAPILGGCRKKLCHPCVYGDGKR